MPKFKVWYTTTYYGFLEVDAATDDDAARSVEDQYIAGDLEGAGKLLVQSVEPAEEA